MLPQAETGSVQLTLDDRVDAGTTAVGGATKTLSITQAARFAETSFTATAGQRVDFGFTGWSFAAGSQLRARVLDSTGAAVIESLVSDGSSFTATAGAAGTYRLIIAPIGFGTGAVILTLSQQIDAGAITLNTNKNLTFPRAGQTSRMTFSGVAGQRLALGMSNVTTPFFPSIQVFKPDNTVLFSDFGTTSVTLPALPVTGTADGDPGTVAAARDRHHGRRRVHQRPDLDPDQRNLSGDDWNTHRPALSGKQPEPLRAAASTTGLSWRALTLDGKGLAGVTVSIDGTTAKTDERGRFLLSGVGAGHRVLRINGTTANTDANKFGLFDIGTDRTSGQTTVWPGVRRAGWTRTPFPATKRRPAPLITVHADCRGRAVRGGATASRLLGLSRPSRSGNRAVVNGFC